MSVSNGRAHNANRRNIEPLRRSCRAPRQVVKFDPYDFDNAKRDKEVKLSFPRLQLAFDVGTTSSSISYRMLFSAEAVASAHIVDVEYEGNVDIYQVPSDFWYDAMGTFWSGYELEARMAEGDVPYSQVVTQAKMACYNVPEMEEIKKLVDAQLQHFGKTLTEAYSDYLNALIEDAIKFVAERGWGTGPVTNLESLRRWPIDLFVTTPDTFDPADNMPLIVAAKAINASTSRVVSEIISLATSASLSVQSWDAITHSPRSGPITVFADCGGGFACFAIVRHKENDNDPYVQMEIVAPTLSVPCGSSRINSNFRNYLRECQQVRNEGGISQLARALGYEPEEFLARTVHEFENSCKKTFRPNINDYHVLVRRRAGSNMPSWTMVITSAELHNLFDPVIHEITRKLKLAIERIPDGEQPSRIFVSGGFSRSPLLLHAIRERFGGQTTNIMHLRQSPIHCLNSHGALLRYHNPSVKGFGETFNLAVIRDELLDPGNPAHHDTFEILPTGQFIANEQLTSPSAYGEHEVYASDRLNWIFKGGREMLESWSLHYPELGGDFNFKQEIIFSERSDGQDGDPLHLRDGITLQSHLKRFATIFYKIDKDRVARWRTTRHRNGERTHMIGICTKIFVSDGAIQIGFKVLDEVGLTEEDFRLRRNCDIDWDLDDGVSRHDLWFSRHDHLTRGIGPED